MPPKTQEEKEREAAEGSSGVGAGVLSMLSSIGGMIPSLRKGPQTSELQRIQRGGGAGAALARQTASEAARRVAGNVQGTDLREGLRAADTIVQRGASQAAVTGAQESALATRALRANEFARRGAFKTLGAGVGQGLAGIAGMLAAAKDQGPVQPEPTPAPTGATPGDAGQAGEVAPQGASAQLQATRALPGAPEGPPGSLPGEAPFPPDLQADPRLGQEQYPGAENKGLQAVQQGRSVQQSLSEVASPERQAEKAVSGLADETAKRQKAELGYQMTASTPEDEAFRVARKQQEEWLYYQAMNYDPSIVGFPAGIDPQSAAQMLQDSGYPVDYQRLGIEGNNGER